MVAAFAVTTVLPAANAFAENDVDPGDEDDTIEQELVVYLDDGLTNHSSDELCDPDEDITCVAIMIAPGATLGDTVAYAYNDEPDRLEAFREVLQTNADSLEAGGSLASGSLAGESLASEVQDTLSQELEDSIAILEAMVSDSDLATLDILEAQYELSAADDPDDDFGEFETYAGSGFLYNDWVWRRNGVNWRVAYCNAGGCSNVANIRGNYQLRLNGGQMLYDHELRKPANQSGTFRIMKNRVTCRRDRIRDEDCSAHPRPGPYASYVRSVSQDKRAYDGTTHKKFLKIAHNVQISQNPGTTVKSGVFTSYRWKCTLDEDGYPWCKFSGAS